MKYDFDTLINRYNSGSYKYDRIQSIYPYANKDSIIMTMADMDFKTAPCIIQDIKSYADLGVFGYMSTFYPPYKQAVISHFKKNYSLDLSEDEIIYSNGVINALKAIIELYSKIDDNIAISEPVYGHFRQLITSLKRKTINIPLKNDNEYYLLDYEKLESSFKTQNIKIYILCSPQNPTGRVYSLEELQKLVKLTQKYNILLVSDEIHMDLTRKNITHYPIFKACNNFENVIMLTGIGKTYNLAGLQCGNILVKDSKLKGEIFNNYDVDINTFALVGLISAYTKADSWKEQLKLYLDDNIDFAVNFIKKNMPYIKVNKPEGTYFLWLNFKGTNLTPKEIEDKIYKQANVLLQSGIEHDPINGSYYQRMCLGLPKSQVKLALERIEKVFSK